MTARQAALKALQRCRRDGAWSSAVIDNSIRKGGLDARDAALAATITLGVLQNKAYCDFYLAHYCSEKLEKLEPKVLDILRIGAYQLLFLDRIPSRAAVNETVELCAQSGVGRAKGLVNAVLRKIADAGEQLPEIPGKGSAEYLSIRYSHPLWLCERLLKEHGYDFAENFMRANNESHSTDIQINTQKISKEKYLALLDEKGIGHTVPTFPENCICLHGGGVTELPGFAEGLFYVQDRAARMAVDLAGIRPGMEILDTCAAPGGKSFAAAMHLQGTGHIMSCDIHEKKLRLLEEGARRLGLSGIEMRCRDGRIFEEGLLETFDVVIADVPCSGFGVIGKKPEIRQKQPGDIAALSGIQLDILNNVSRFVKKGGILLYSTCTIFHEENEDIVREFLDMHPDFEAVDFQIEGRASQNGCYTFWPNIDGTDGFFAAKIRKKR